MDNSRILVLDTEASGLTAEHALTSFAGVMINSKFEILSSYYSLVKYDDKMLYDDKALEMTKLSRELLKTYGSSIEKIRGPIQRLFDLSTVIVCHNCAFDIGMMIRYGFKIRPDCFFDTMHFSWDTWDGKRAKLGMVCERVGIDASGAHNSMDDVMMVVRLLEWFTDNNHITMPPPTYPIVTDYFQHHAFGYNKMRKKGLLEKK